MVILSKVALGAIYKKVRVFYRFEFNFMNFHVNNELINWGDSYSSQSFECENPITFHTSNFR